MASRARASRTQERGAGRQGCPLCSRTAHSGFNCSGPRRMECSVDARSEGQPSRPPPEKMRRMVCRVPVAFQIATGDDARNRGSARPPRLVSYAMTFAPNRMPPERIWS